MRARRAVALALLGLMAIVPCVAQDSVSVAASPRTRAKGPTGTVSGTVYCADTNAPARLAQIFLTPASRGKSDDAPPRMGVVDLDGHFVLGNVSEGKYYVKVALAGYLNPMGNLTAGKLAAMNPEARRAAEARLVVATVSAKQAAELAIRLERAAEIAGTVLFDDGSPGIGLQVRLDPKPDKEEPQNPGNTFESFAENMDKFNSTDDHGRFRIVGVAPGEYLVSVRIPTFSGEQSDSLGLYAALPNAAIGSLTVYYDDAFRASKAKVVKIESAGGAVNADITIHLTKLHTIRGHMALKSTGDPPAAGAVLLQYADTHENARMALVNESGEFSFFYVPEGSYNLAGGASPERLPQFPGGDGEDSGVLSSDFGVHIDDQLPEGAGTLTLLVRSDVTGITLSVPDPAPVPQGTEKPASPENPSAPPNPPQ